MHLLGETPLGILLLILIAVLVAVKRGATGSFVEIPTGGALERVVNTFNLAFLLVVLPVTALLLAAGRYAAVDPTRVTFEPAGLRAALEAAGLVIAVAGFALMVLALATLGRVYQLGGMAPRPSDHLVARGPYALVRHPMYAAALAIAFGAATLVQSLALAAVFVVYVVLIVPVIPREEAALRAAYGQRYAYYQRRTSRLLPFIF